MLVILLADSAVKATRHYWCLLSPELEQGLPVTDQRGHVGSFNKIPKQYAYQVFKVGIGLLSVKYSR